MTDEAPITMAEVHAAGFCARGQRAWLDKRLPGWRKLYLKGGMPVEVLAEVNPAILQQVRRLREARRGQET